LSTASSHLIGTEVKLEKKNEHVRDMISAHVISGDAINKYTQSIFRVCA